MGVLIPTNTPIFPKLSDILLCRYEAIVPPSTDKFADLLTTIFSPILEIISACCCSIVKVESTYLLDNKLLWSELVLRATSATFRTKVWKSLFLETKSVSELTSTIDPKPLFPLAIPINPSAAILPDLEAAETTPFFLNQSIACSISPLVCIRAFLQSIIPASVLSLNAFTSEAEISKVLILLNNY